MKKIGFIFIILAVLVSCRNNPPAPAPVSIILDTDCGPDYDDVGALAFLHSMADSGKAVILATLSSNRNELVAPSIDVLNTYFGRPGLPLGSPKSGGADMGAAQHWADSITTRYPHTVKSTSEVPDAVSVYRKILSSQPDKNVTIVTIGFLTNLANLLKSAPDSHSSLTGSELVSRKVKNLVCMAGWFPKGREFNIFIDSTASKYVFENWPGNVTFTGFETGKEIKTGLKLVNSGIEGSPVKDVFRISMAASPEDRLGRMSWDETAVLIAVYGSEKFFNTVQGTIHIAEDGSNTWENDPSGRHSYVILKTSPEEAADFIEARMMHIPAVKNK
jgi:inosine-uridine nucleoside N-ribohydrolase